MDLSVEVHFSGIDNLGRFTYSSFSDDVIYVDDIGLIEFEIDDWCLENIGADIVLKYTEDFELHDRSMIMHEVFIVFPEETTIEHVSLFENHYGVR